MAESKDTKTPAAEPPPAFTAVDVAELPARGSATMSDANRAAAEAVAAMIATGKAARSNAIFDTQRKAYDAGQAINRNIRKLALTGADGKPLPKLSVRGILVAKDQFTFAITVADEKKD